MGDRRPLLTDAELRARAEGLEALARNGGGADAYRVASDAWLEAGEEQRARELEVIVEAVELPAGEYMDLDARMGKVR